MASLSEVSYFLLFTRDVERLDESDWKTLNGLREHASRVTWGLYKSVRERAKRG